MAAVARRDFFLLLGGSSISALGDQFTLVAMPWLVLKLTSSPAELGLVLATLALPRALLMLVGGAVVDRMSPRRVLLMARGINALLIALLAALVLDGQASILAVYGIAACTGLATAFAYPAGSSVLPQILPRDQLAKANATMMSARQLTTFAGPALAGLVISTDIHGLGLAFAFDAASFLFSLVSLMLVRTPDQVPTHAVRKSIAKDMLDGIRLAWKDLPLRAFMLYGAAVMILIGGPLQVGLPLLANTRLDFGAASLGILITANGGGMLIGSMLSVRLIPHLQGRLGLTMLFIDGVVGVAFASLALIHSTWGAALLLALIGALKGMIQITVTSWIQQHASQATMGRTMSLVFFVFMGVGPLSTAVSGGLLQRISLPTLFLGSGLLLAAMALASIASPALRDIRVLPAEPALEANRIR
jgi:MFS family permease